MEAIDGLAASAQSSLGVSSSVAQVLVWVVIFLIGYIIFQVLSGGSKGGGVLKSRSRGNAVLVLGQCGAGKTALFFRLRDQAEEIQSVSSLKPLRDKMSIAELDGVGPLDVIDFPGHQRMRRRAAELIKEARCIVYVIDSEDKPKLKDAAEHLYELMTHPDLLELHTPILLTLNKIDMPSARTDKYVVDEVDREIELMRNSRGATLEGQDQADSYLGIDGQKFKILEHAPCPVQSCRISVKRKELGPLYDFLRQQYS